MPGLFPPAPQRGNRLYALCPLLYALSSMPFALCGSEACGPGSSGL